MPRRHEWIIVIVALVLLNVSIFLFQKRITLNDGLGWDGVAYAKLVTDFASGKLPSTDAPFIYRIGLPIVVSWFGTLNIPESFLILNVIANCVCCLLLLFWVAHFITPSWIRLTIIALYILPFHSLVRRVYWHPVDIDHWFAVFLLLGLIVMARPFAFTGKGVLAMSIISFLGTFARESMLIIPLSYLVLCLPWRWSSDQPRRLLVSVPNFQLIPLGASLFALVIIRNMVAPQHFSPIGTGVSWLYNKPFPDYVYAWFIAFGLIPVVLLWRVRRVFSFLCRNLYLGVLLGAVAILAYVGGSATYRLLTWASPIVLLLLGVAIEGMNCSRYERLIVSIVAMLHLVSQRVFWLMPDFPHPDTPKGIPMFLTLLQFDVNPVDLFGMGDWYFRAVGMGQYVIVSGILLALLGIVPIVRIEFPLNKRLRK